MYPIPGSRELDLWVRAIVLVPGTGTVIANVQSSACSMEDACRARIQMFRR